MPTRILYLLFVFTLMSNAILGQSDVNNKIDSLETKLNTATGEVRLDLLLDLSDVWNKISLKKSLNYYEESLRVATVLNDKEAVAKILKRIGFIYNDMGVLDSALIYARKSFKLYEEIGDEEGVGNVNKLYTSIYISLGTYDKAMQYAIEAINIFKKTNNKSQLAGNYTDLGIIYTYQGNKEKALECYLKSLDLFAELQEPFSKLYTLNNIGVLYNELNEHKIALTYFEQSFEINKKNGDMVQASLILLNIGEVYRDLGNFNKAIEYYQKAMDIGGESINGIALINLGLAHGAMQEFDKANEELTQALQIFRDNNPKCKTECYKSLWEVSKAQGNNTKALKFYELYIGLKDSIYSEENDKRLTALHIAYETERKEQQIIQQEEELETQQYWLIMLVSGLVGIIVFLIIIYLQKSQLKKANKELVHKNLEIVETEKDTESVTKISKAELSKEISKYTGSSLDIIQKQELLKSILYAMETEKVYTNSGMNLQKLAEHLHTNSKYISQVINERVNVNFSTFLNEYRIKEARRKLADPVNSNLTIESIANDVGFQSISTFNNVFKKQTGITPSFFMKSARESH